jgi:hypothetical protein
MSAMQWSGACIVFIISSQSPALPPAGLDSLHHLQRRVCQRAALQARFRSRTSSLFLQELTLPCESTVALFLPDNTMRLQNRISLAKIARYTLVRVVMGDVQGRPSPCAVAEYQAHTSPRMRVRHFIIAGVAWSNFKPGINTNGRTAI